jgi:hypothetical protein
MQLAHTWERHFSYRLDDSRAGPRLICAFDAIETLERGRHCGHSLPLLEYERVTARIIDVDLTCAPGLLQS